MSLDHPLLLLLALPALAAVAWLRRRMAVRAALVLAAVGAAAGPRFGETGEAPRCRVYVLDVSASVGPSEALTLAKHDAGDLGSRDEVAAVWVAERAQAAIAPGPVERLLELAPSRLLPPNGASKLSEGIDFAASLIPAGRRGEIVVVSDGREVPGGGAGAVSAAVARRRGFTVRTLPCGANRRADARVDRVEAPGRVRAGERFDAVVTVSASFPTRATVSLGGEAREVALEAGVPARVVFPQKPATEAITWLEAKIVAKDFRDVAPANDVNEAPVFLDGKLPLLVLAPEAGRAAEIALAADPRFSVETAAKPGDLALFAAAVVDGLPADELGDKAMDAIRRYVQGGGGLVLLGGPAGFGAGGYGHTPLDLPSPVESVPQDNFVLCVLLDASGSMNEELSPGRAKIAAARDALRSLVAAAREDTTFAFAAFAGDARWIHPPTTDRAPLLKAIESVDASGATRIAPALDKARQAGAGKRHIVLISDGQSGEDEKDLVAKADALRAAGATISAIAEGDDANLPLLRKLSADHVYVMKTFGELAALLREDLAKEQGLTAKGPFAVEGLPAVLELNVVKPKDGAETVLLAGGRPLAAVRQFGKGRSAALASALDGAWVADPARWGAEVAGLAARVARPDAGGRLTLSVDGDDLVADWQPATAGDEATVEATLTLPDELTQRVNLLRAGPSRFTARLRHPETGRFLLTAGPTRAAASRPWPAEYASAGARPDLLAALAGPASGPPPALPPPSSLAPWLLALAVALVLLEAWMETLPTRTANATNGEKPATVA